MANLPISGFPTGGTIAQAGDEFVIARSGANYKLTSSSISAFVLGGPTTQLGAADVASGAVAQTLQVQSNTGAATTGPNFTIKGSSGTTAGGSIIFQTHNGTSFGTALTIASDKSATFSSTVNFPANSTINTSGTFQAGGTGTPSCAIASTGIFLANSTPLQWSSTNSWSGGSDVFLYRDGQPNTLALKNAGNAQIFRAYSTTTGPNYGYFAAGVTDAGVATADTLFIGTGGAGAAMTKLALVVNGTSALSFTTNGAFRDAVFNNNVTCGGFVSPSFVRLSNGRIYGGPVDGSLTLYDTNETGAWNRINFGANGASNPAIKRSLTTLQVRLADDSGDAAFQCGTQTAGGTAFNVNGTGGNSIASVTNTTTGTLLQVLNSTSNPLMTVTDTTSGTLFSVQSTTAATLFSVNDTTSGTLLAVTNSSATDVFTVSDAGVLTVASGSASATTLTFGTANTGWYNRGTNWAYSVGGNQLIELSGGGTGGLEIVGNYALSFGVTPATNPPDVFLYRDNAAELALRNGNNGQIFRVYGRYTDASNYERFFINAPTTAGTAVQIGTQKAGSGTARALALQTDGTTRLTIAAGGDVITEGNHYVNGTLAVGSTSASNVFAAIGSAYGGIKTVSTAEIRWGNSTTDGLFGTVDLILGRDTSNTLGLRNSTYAQTFNVYGSYVGTTNYQRVVVKTLREVSSALSGATYVSTIAIPAYALLVGVTTRVNTAITGATSYSVGDGTTANLWGNNIGIALNSQSQTSDFTAVGAVGAAATSRTVTLTANGSNFTGGVVEICLHYLTTEAD